MLAQTVESVANDFITLPAAPLVVVGACKLTRRSSSPDLTGEPDKALQRFLLFGQWLLSA